MHVLRSRHSATRTANGKAHRLAVKNVRLLPNRAQKRNLPSCEYLVNLPHPAGKDTGPDQRDSHRTMSMTMSIKPQQACKSLLPAFRLWSLTLENRTRGRSCPRHCSTVGRSVPHSSLSLRQQVVPKPSYLEGRNAPLQKPTLSPVSRPCHGQLMERSIPALDCRLIVAYKRDDAILALGRVGPPEPPGSDGKHRDYEDLNDAIDKWHTRRLSHVVRPHRRQRCPLRCRLPSLMH